MKLPTVEDVAQVLTYQDLRYVTDTKDWAIQDSRGGWRQIPQSRVRTRVRAAIMKANTSNMAVAALAAYVRAENQIEAIAAVYTMRAFANDKKAVNKLVREVMRELAAADGIQITSTEIFKE